VSEPSARPAGPARPLPSSTVLVLREAAAGRVPFEVLLVKRHGSVTFPGVHAFPGGILDPHDADAPGADVPRGQRWHDAPEADRPPEVVRYWIAALRELFEEVGILVAYRGGRLLEGPLAPEVDALRATVLGGRGFAAVLRDIDAVPATDRVYAFARWVTPVVNPKRFDTRFVVTRLPPGQVVHVDGTENESHRWAAPAVALDAYARGEIDLIPPTVRTLDDLARFGSIDAVLASARARRILPACPEIETAGARVTMTYPSPCPDDPLPARRLVLEDGRWRPLDGEA
jgi:8-oxo-dGTP pyrophosphatase MutT (NUDIX family)